MARTILLTIYSSCLRGLYALNNNQRATKLIEVPLSFNNLYIFFVIPRVLEISNYNTV